MSSNKQEHKYELSVDLNSGIKCPVYTLRAESWGADRHELLHNLCVYMLDSQDSELACYKLEECSDWIYWQAVAKIKELLTEQELKEVYCE